MSDRLRRAVTKAVGGARALGAATLTGALIAGPAGAANPCAAKNPCAARKVGAAVSPCSANPCAAQAAADKAVNVGQPAPEFSLQSTTGDKISLGQYRGKQAVLIYFYSQDFNPT